MNSIFKKSAAFRLLCYFLCVLALPAGPLSAQTTISTQPTYTNNNGSGIVTFNFQNTNAYPVNISGIGSISGNTNPSTWKLWYRTTPVSGAPGIVSVANGWVLAATSTFTSAIGSTSTNTAEAVISGATLQVPANTTYAIAVSGFVTGSTSGTQRYMTIPSANLPTTTFSGGGCNIITGTNISYGGTAEASAPGNSPRGFVGSVTFSPVSLAPCTDPPTAGSLASNANGSVCPGTSVDLTLSGNTMGSGLTIQWESSTTNSPFTPTAIGAAGGSTSLTVTPTVSTWYRAKLVCSGGTPVYTTPVQVAVSGGLPAGTYTINSALPTSGNNYTSFTAAIAALNCGIAGPVVFNVTPGSGPYTETVNIGNVLNTTAVNTITFNGNGATVQFDNTTSNRALLTLNGSKYIKFDSIVFKSLNADYGYGALITNSSRYDSITRCTFDLSSIDGTSSTSSSGIVFSASATSATAAGDNGDKCFIGYNKVLGRTGSGGPYYGISVAGASDSNVFTGNTVQNFYYYGVRIADATGTVLRNNNINRSSKTATTVFYGIYTTGTTPGTVIEGNRIHSPIDNAVTAPNTFYGLYLLGDATAANPVNVINNAVYNINHSGVVRGIYLSSATNHNIFHNTIAIDRVLPGTSANTGIYLTGTNTNVIVKNNNVSITAGSEGDKYGFYYNSAASAGNAQKNNFYVNSTQPGAQRYGYYTTDYATMAAFQAAYAAWEAGSVSVDPQFTAANTGDFTPLNFLLYAAGENLNTAVPADINGTVRISTPTPGAFEMPQPAMNNAGMVSLIAPSGSLCAGTYPLSFSIINAGANTLNTLQVNWSVNGVLQTPFTYNGPLYAITNLSAQSVDTVTVGTVTLSSTIPASIVAWTSVPNGVADIYNANDTLSVSLTAAMSGAYTIDAALPAGGSNYQSFTAFSEDLLLKGICGPVVANVNPASGPYNELVKFGNITGASAANTIRINGNGALVQYANDATNRQLLTLSGSRYLTLDSLNFKALATTYGWGALITGDAQYDSISRCVFDLTTVTTTASASSSGICFSGSSTSATTAGSNGSHCYIGHNRLLGTTGSGGYYYGITVCGASDSNVVEHNELLNFYFYGIYVSGAAGTRVLFNEVHRSTKTAVTTFYGIYTTGDAPGTRVTGNRVHTPGGVVSPASTSSAYGIYASADGTSANRCLVSNNLVYDINQGGIAAGIYGITAVETDIVHNTVDLSAVLSTSSTSTNYGIYVSGTANGTTNVKNNLVSITGGNGGVKYGLYYVSTSSVAASERNSVYVNSTQPGTQNYGYIAAAMATLADFQAANTSYEIGSVSVDPQFASPASAFYLPLHTALNSYGVNQLGLVPTDILGVTRAAAPTPGAFETDPGYFNNAAVTALVNPSGNFCSGPRPVSVTIANHGINDLNSLEIHWTVNGVVQTTYSYTGPLDDVYSGNNTATVAIGTAVFPAGVASVVKVWTDMPNTVTDPDPSNDTITITVQPSYSVIVDLGNDTAVCEGTTVTLDAGNTGATYLWDNGTTSQTAGFTAAGPHYVTVIAADGCQGSDTFHLTTIAMPQVDLGNDTVICPGTLLTLDAGNPGSTYLWNDGITTQTRDVTDATSYSVTVSNNGCSASDAITVSHINTPVADGINATYGDSATYTFYPINPQYAAAYIWNFGDGSPLVTGLMVQHTYTQNGIFTVSCQMQSLCDTASLVGLTRTVDVFDAAGGVTGIGNTAADKGWSVYPNPAKNSLSVENKAGTAIRTAEVYSVVGQKMLTARFDTAKASIDIASLHGGIYLLKVTAADNSVMVIKFEKAAL